MTPAILYHFSSHDWGSQGEHKAKPIGFIFSLFYLIRIKFNIVMKHINLNNLKLFLIKIFLNKGNNGCFIDSVKNFHVVMLLDINLSIWSWNYDRYNWVLHFDVGLTDLDFD